MEKLAKARRRGVLLARPVDDDPRCRDCGGVCCRSFPTVELSWPEYQTLRALGARCLEFSLTGHHKLIIENGCEFLVQGRCSIYEHRPDVCRRFHCED
jgi:Fe-S-cluster containining protein